MSEDAIRGLVGELVFLRDVSLPSKEAGEALQSWRGPLGGLHDFQFASVSVEVKAVSERLIATISSAAQLDGGGDRLYLAAVRLHNTTEPVAQSFSVAELVEQLREAFKADTVTPQGFEDRLALVGYKDAREYETTRFVVKEMRYFEVGPDFPRLVPSMLPHGLVNLAYGVDLHACDAFRRPDVAEGMA